MEVSVRTVDAYYSRFHSCKTCYIHFKVKLRVNYRAQFTRDYSRKKKFEGFKCETKLKSYY